MWLECGLINALIRCKYYKQRLNLKINGQKSKKHGYCTYILMMLLNLKYHFDSIATGSIKQNDSKQPTKQNKKKVFRQKLFQKVKKQMKKPKIESKKHIYNKV